MPFAMFHDYFPDTAKAETRSITILHDADWDLPAGGYGFLEMFCDEPGCDCRRVFYCVLSERSRRVEAYITYGWESLAHCRNWLGYDDPMPFVLCRAQRSTAHQLWVDRAVSDIRVFGGIAKTNDQNGADRTHGCNLHLRSERGGGGHLKG